MLTAVSLSADDIWENLIEVAGPESIKITVSLRQAQTGAHPLRVGGRLACGRKDCRDATADQKPRHRSGSVRIPPRFVGGGTGTQKHREACRSEDLGLWVSSCFSEDGQVDLNSMQGHQGTEEGGALSSLGAYRFLIQTRVAVLGLQLKCLSSMQA